MASMGACYLNGWSSVGRQNFLVKIRGCGLVAGLWAFPCISGFLHECMCPIVEKGVRSQRQPL